MSNPKPIGCAGRFLCARGGERGTGGGVRGIARALRAIGRDDEVRLASLSSELRQQWPDDAFVIRVRKYCEDWARGLSVGLLRERRDEGGDNDGVCENSHAILCNADRACARSIRRL